MRKWIVLALQVVVSGCLLAWIFREPEFREDVWELLSEADRRWLAAAFAVAGLGVAMGLVRWAIFLRVVGIDLRAWDVVRIGAVGLFFNNFLPGAVGGDAVKIGWLVAGGHGARPALLSVVMDRMSGLGAMVVCSLTFISLRFEWLMESAAVAALIHMVFVYLAVVVVLVGVSFLAAARGTVERLPARLPGRATILEFAATYSLFVRAWRSTLLASCISVVTLLAYFFTFYLCALALGVRVEVLDFMAMMPSVDLLAALPISAGGFGVREGAFVTLLGQLCDVPSAEAVSLSFAGALMGLGWSCAGLLALPYARRPVR